MTHPEEDPYNLARFVDAQRDDYARALVELKQGCKQTHWMWYIFPQLTGLGSSATAQHYAIKSVAEAKAYLRHPILGPRLVECSEILLRTCGRSAAEIFGSPDDLKLKSCATLFAHISPAGSVFQRLLDQYFAASADEKTLNLLSAAS